MPNDRVAIYNIFKCVMFMSSRLPDATTTSVAGI